MEANKADDSGRLVVDPAAAAKSSLETPAAADSISRPAEVTR
jgi:hypothetical protein